MSQPKLCLPTILAILRHAVQTLNAVMDNAPACQITMVIPTLVADLSVFCTQTVPVKGLVFVTSVWILAQELVPRMPYAK